MSWTKPTAGTFNGMTRTRAEGQEEGDGSAEGDVPGQGAGRPIRPDERSGMLQPRNLERYRATWFDPAPDVRVAVDRYWCVRWNLAPGEALAQRVIDLPAVTLTVEEGDVPGPLVVTGVHRKAWRRRITGSGSVFAVRLRPAGLALLGDLRPGRVADATVVLTPELDPRLHSLMAGVAAGDTPEARARLADGMIGGAPGRVPCRCRPAACQRRADGVGGPGAVACRAEPRGAVRGQ
ncbi:hypothetical protein GCM10028793_03440 [Nocardiopsis oceani]